MDKEDFFSSVAFFDSGQGGFTVWESVRKLFPTLNTLYLGDNARCPYGNKSQELIVNYAREGAQFLCSQGAKLIVVACGTASTAAIHDLRSRILVPIIGIVEGFCEVAADLMHSNRNTKRGTAVVLGTRFTVGSRKFEEELALQGIHSVWARACPLFVPLVEEGVVQGSIAESVADMYLWDIPPETEIVMLACTHYPRLVRVIAGAIENRLGRTVIYKAHDGDLILIQGKNLHMPPVYLLDSSSSILIFIDNFLKNKSVAAELLQSQNKVYCTHSPTQFEQLARYFTSMQMPSVSTVDLSPYEKGMHDG